MYKCPYIEMVLFVLLYDVSNEKSYCLGAAILMSTDNIGLYGKLPKNLSFNYHQYHQIRPLSVLLVHHFHKS